MAGYFSGCRGWGGGNKIKKEERGRGERKVKGRGER